MLPRLDEPILPASAPADKRAPRAGRFTGGADRLDLRAMARLTLRVDFAAGQSIGHGKIRLLEAVRDHGSIAAAGRAMKMSYRRAWLLIEELNAQFAQPVIATRHGGSSGGGALLTPLGQRLVEHYRAIERKAGRAAAADLAALEEASGEAAPAAAQL